LILETEGVEKSDYQPGTTLPLFILIYFIALMLFANIAQVRRKDDNNLRPPRTKKSSYPPLVSSTFVKFPKESVSLSHERQKKTQF